MSSGRIKRIEPLGTKLPVLGTIKIGAKVKNQNGKELPVSYDYFVVDPKSKYADLFTKVYGDKPSKIEIVFVSDNLQDACNERYEVWDKQGRRWAEGDGEVWKCYNRKLDAYEEGISAKKEEILKRYCEDGGKMMVVLTLQFILPKIPGVFGVWRLSTKGEKSSILGITTTFDKFQSMVGTVVNIPFDLVVAKVKSLKPGSASVFPVLTLVPNISKENMDTLANYISQGSAVPRGLLTDDAIRNLVEQSNATAQLEEHIEYADVIDEKTGEIIEATQNAQEEENDKYNVIASKEEQKEIWELAKTYKLTSDNMKMYLKTAFKIDTFTEIKQIYVYEIKHAIKEGFVRRFIDEQENKTNQKPPDDDLPF